MRELGLKPQHRAVSTQKLRLQPEVMPFADDRRPSVSARLGLKPQHGPWHPELRLQPEVMPFADDRRPSDEVRELGLKPEHKTCARCPLIARTPG